MSVGSPEEVIAIAIQATMEQWPIVTIILFFGYKGAHSIVRWARTVETKLESAQTDGLAAVERMEGALKEIADHLRDGIREIRSRADRHSREIAIIREDSQNSNERLSILESELN